jgi:L-rhamnose mutarotase
LLDEETKKILRDANSGSFDCNKNNRIFSLVRAAHELISEVANQPGNDQWKDQMAPLLENQKLIWVKKEILSRHPGV